jgi:exodeoxyribonuclease V
MISLSTDQQKALDNIMSWYFTENRSKFITLGGYAGTGKTTLISVFRKNLHKQNKKLKIAFVSFTGKAARVLRNKLTETKSLYDQDFCGTIHSFIYSPIVNDREEIIGWQMREEIEADLIIVDEASMVDEKIWTDLLSYNIPIVAVGDHGQLPPISGNFNLMGKPNLKLEEIHRQAKGNPIIQLSILARSQGTISVGKFGINIEKFDKQEIENQERVGELLQSYNEDTLILCGFNYTRIKLNGFVRSALEFESIEPHIGDRVICLRNNHKKKIYNGMLGTIDRIESEDEHWYSAQLLLDDDEQHFQGLIYKKQFNSPTGINFTEMRGKALMGDLFDFGYALTVHKAQGSQAKRVILFEERSQHMDDEMWSRWLYTGITRAEEELFIIGN